MKWIKIARLAVAVFVALFAIVVVVAMRSGREPAKVPPTPRTDPKAQMQSPGPSTLVRSNQGKVLFSMNSQGHVAYPDGRVRHQKAEITLPDRNGRDLKLIAAEVEVLPAPKGSNLELGKANLTGGVRLETSDGLVIMSKDGTYDETTGMLNVPGNVEFSKGRMKGTGVGATYDRPRDVVWLLANAQVDVTADEKGQGALTATASTAGLARADHYVRLTGKAHITGDGRTSDADEVVMRLTEDNARLQVMELRGHSRIAGGASGPQSMEAADIDLTYGADGRSLQNADLRERASVRLAGAGGAPGRTITGQRIQIAMAPDGATVTNLNATQNVQLELPADGATPARRIRAAALTAAGAPESGLQSATFDGNVTFDEWRAAAKNQPAATRTARSRKLIVETQPGLGAVQRADFRGNVRFIDGKTTAEAPRAIYNVAQDTIDLSPVEGEAGPEPQVDDGQVSVKARTISFGLTSKKLEAETDVRSSLQPSRQTDTTKLPSMLKKDEPVSVTANRLSYDGAATLAKYTGQVNLWQGQTSIKADAIDVDDRTGNLAARGNVRTVMWFEDEDPTTKKRTLAQTIASGDTFLYEEAKRLAIYTTGASAKAHINGPQGDVVGDRIELYLQPKVNELDRAVADGNVVVKESNRIAKGAHLTHTASDQKYVLTGAPVDVDERTPPECKRTIGATVTFYRAAGDVVVEGIPGVQPMEIKPYKCTGESRD